MLYGRFFVFEEGGFEAVVKRLGIAQSSNSEGMHPGELSASAELLRRLNQGTMAVPNTTSGREGLDYGMKVIPVMLPIYPLISRRDDTW